jgi:hypothetical protein
VFDPEVVVAPNGHVRGYFAAWRGSPGQTACYDWNTAGSCTGFPAPHPTVNGGATRDYGYAYDSTTDCLVALGDAGVLFSVDPATGAPRASTVERRRHCAPARSTATAAPDTCGATGTHGSRTSTWPT